uniref:PPM-type phosphatase domain-containing protein n=1 Tax=Entomoneis paludosa TaxID=265537 RepID=A0A7S3DS32_9STRA
MALSEDHKPDLPGEQARIEEAGLKVVHETYTEESEGETAGKTSSIAKVQLSEMNVLGMSRSFGDFEYKKSDIVSAAESQAVICVPDVHVLQRVPDRDEYLVLACDGIWDVQSNKDVSEFIRSKNGENGNNLAATGEALLQECIHSDDNLSLILVSFQEPEPNVDTLLTPEISKLRLGAEEDEEGDLALSPGLAAAKTLNFASPEKDSKS